jgi:hypothetical protein
VVLVSLDDNGAYHEVLADHETSAIELPLLITFDNNTGLLKPNQVPTTTESEEVTLDHPEPQPPVGPTQPIPTGDTTESIIQDVDMKFTVPIKKLGSVAMEMSMNFEEVEVEVHFKGKPKKGQSQDPTATLKNLIEQGGGNVE